MLPVPKHTHSNSVGGSSTSSFPQFLGTAGRHRSSKSQSSLLKTTNASIANSGNYNLMHTPSGGSSVPNDELSIKLTDRVHSTKPLITYSDKLWTQIDVLDDVKDMSHQVKLRGSFFNDSFNDELAKLKASQNQLLESMSQHHSHIRDMDLLNQMYKISNANSSKQVSSKNSLHAGSGGDKVTAADVESRMNIFFDEEDIQTSILHREQDIQELDKYIEETRQNLHVVSQSMKDFDNATKGVW